MTLNFTIVRATVPVVKVTDNITNLVLDISYSNSSGELVADFVKSKLVCDKRIGALVIILKTILSCYSMHLPAAGGCLGFLKTYDEQDLGSLLKECLKYYGLVFNADVHGVSVDGTFNRVECGWAQRLGTLAVKDPCDENNNITVNSFKWPTIKKLFAMSYNALYYTNHVNYPPQKSLLKRILKIPSEFEELRERWKGLSCKELELNDNRG
ncbi:PAP-associated domain-containing protein [Entamoeba marina]